MSILVLGGAGYIGSHTVQELLTQGCEVVVADNLSTGFAAAVPREARFYQLDIRDLTALDRLFAVEKIDGVIHFAAFSQVGESMHKPLTYFDNNLHGTLVLLQTMQKHGVNKIVFSSTAAVYGEPASQPILETAPTQPTNCYGETKLAMEKMMHWTAQAHALRYVALRYFNACGAHPSGRLGEAHKPETHLIPLTLQIVMGQRPELTIFGTNYPTPDGTCIRDYIHVCDLAKAHILALKYLEQGGASTAFNLGNSQGFSVRQVIDTAGKVVGRPIPYRLSERRPGDPAVLIASSQKARQVLGWQPEYTDLEAIIQTAWHWHQTHPQGFDQ